MSDSPADGVPDGRLSPDAPPPADVPPPPVRDGVRVAAWVAKDEDGVVTWVLRFADMSE